MKATTDIYKVFWQLIANCVITKSTPRCWEYKPHSQTGYVTVKVPNSKYFTSNSTFLHRYVYAVYNDCALTPDDVIMHTCDNRICVNPLHLKKGTIQTNNLDRDRKRKKSK